MLYNNEDAINNKDRFLFSKIILWVQLVFFGGWNGLQIMLQPQDLSIFVNERKLLDNYFFTMSYSWQNIPLICSLLFAIVVIWNYISVTIDHKIINSLKKKDDIEVIPYKDKDNISIFITLMSLFAWMICFGIIYFIPLWNLNFLTNLVYDITGLNRFQEPLYILLILVTSSITMMLRIQILLFYKGGSEINALTKLKESFMLMKSYYIKSWLVNLLFITLSLLIYKHGLLNIFIYLRSLFPKVLVVNFPLLVNRIDVLSSIPSFILLFLVSSLLFSPVVIYIYRRILENQYNFFKQQYIKNKNKKDIDEKVITYFDSI